MKVIIRKYDIDLFDEKQQPLGLRRIDEKEAGLFAQDHVIYRCKLCNCNFVQRKQLCCGNPRQKHEFVAHVL